MKIVQVHNWYKIDSGENISVEGLIHLLKAKGEQVTLFKKNSNEITSSFGSKILAFSAGLYSPFMARAMGHLLDANRPDVVHVHNLYPLISPSILKACTRYGVPVVMTSHNFRLSCPVGPHFYKETKCLQCTDGREYWCILNNCRESLFESTAYALRNMVARKFRLFKDNVTLFIAPSEYVKLRLMDSGFREGQIVVVPNMISMISPPPPLSGQSLGEYIGFVGRISPVKGIRVLMQAAALNPSLPFYIAGDYSEMPGLLEEAPKNVRFLGQLQRSELATFYRRAKFIVAPSLCSESFGLVAAEAMSQGRPVISSATGGLQEIVTDGINGFLVEPGNAEELTGKIRLLWENSDLCQKMGEAGQKKAIQEYSEDVYYQRLLAVYRKGIDIKASSKSSSK